MTGVRIDGGDAVGRRTGVRGRYVRGRTGDQSSRKGGTLTRRREGRTDVKREPSRRDRVDLTLKESRPKDLGSGFPSKRQGTYKEVSYVVSDVHVQRNSQ